jgi:hypothetical protein
MRLVSEETVVTASSYPGFYGYWGYWNTAYDPGVYATAKLYSVETALYSMPNATLAWMGRSQTIDPKNENKLADYSVNFAVNNMKKDGFIR